MPRHNPIDMPPQPAYRSNNDNSTFIGSQLGDTSRGYVVIGLYDTSTSEGETELLTE